MVFSGPSVSFSFLIPLSCCRLFWTKLLLRIHDNRWRHVQTLHLSSELLHLPLLHLPPPAEQVQVRLLPQRPVHTHQRAVGTGRTDEVRREVALRCPIEGEAAAL